MIFACKIIFTYSLYFMLSSINQINGFNIEHTQEFGHISPSTRCDGIRQILPNADINLDQELQKGKICGSHCCSHNTENHLRNASVNEFKIQIEHHTKSLERLLKVTADSFKNHILELLYESQNKASNSFNKLFPENGSKHLLHNLYSTLIAHFKTQDQKSWLYRKHTEGVVDIEKAVNKFFVELFPIAYFSSIKLKHERNGVLHEDYSSCLKHIYNELKPFGTIPRELSSKLTNSSHSANDFIYALSESADVLRETRDLESTLLSDTCQNQLLKMNYCTSCNNIQKNNVNKICHSYCLNIIRGCLAQYGFAELDRPWTKVAESIENLIGNSIQTDNGILKSVKNIDVLLSEGIMYIMKDSTQLEEKVTQNCGPTSTTTSAETSNHISPTSNNKPQQPSDYLPELLKFLTALSNSKQIYENIVKGFCSGDDVRTTDKHCWTGERIGDYTYTTTIPGGAETQKYNPEVPLTKDLFKESSKLNELVDRLIKIRSNMGNNGLTSSKYSDIQGDMAELAEGSGRIIKEYVDNDTEDEDEEASGSGSNPIPEEDVSAKTNANGGATRPISAISILVSTWIIIYNIN